MVEATTDTMLRVENAALLIAQLYRPAVAVLWLCPREREPSPAPLHSSVAITVSLADARPAQFGELVGQIRGAARVDRSAATPFQRCASSRRVARPERSPATVLTVFLSIALLTALSGSRVSTAASVGV